MGRKIGGSEKKKRSRVRGVSRGSVSSGGGGTPYDGLYGEAPPERGFRYSGIWKNRL